MDNEIVEEVTEWESQQFSGGYDGLRELADEEFTGAVTNGATWLFVLNGRIVAAVDGSVETFANADGTAYRAPHPSVPLLFAMQERGGETKAKYYTEETPLSEVNETLVAGNFTGYIELSENVLSGDYYVAYHGGRALACAFIGNNRSLLTGEEALERADDEVGIYEVYDVDIDVVSIPDDGNALRADAGGATEDDAEDGTAAEDIGENANDDVDEDANGDIDEGENDDIDMDGASAVSSESAAAGESDDGAVASESTARTGERTIADPATDATSDVGTAVDSQSGSAVEEGAGSRASQEGTDLEVPDDVTAAEATNAESDDRAEVATEKEVDGDVEAADTDAKAVTGSDATTDAGEAPPDGSAGEDVGPRPDPSLGPAAGTQSAVTQDEATDELGVDEDPFSEEAEWRNTQSIPSLDPSNSQARAREESGAGGGENGAATPQADRSEEPTGQTDADATTTTRPETKTVPADTENVAQLRDQLRELEAAREEAEVAKERLAAERDDYREETQRLESRVEQLEEEVERLEAELADARRRDDGTPTRTMPSTEALTGTNLFVRYETKGGATLENAHAGDVERDAVVENLRLEHHTSFDTEGLRVAGDRYETFLQETIEYRFVRWVVEDLLYEIRETGNEAALDELFDAIPEIDRAELRGSVSVEYQRDGEQHREQEQFDVVLRDRMGNPLLVADLNTSRDPATGEMMTDLVEAARLVKDTSDTLSSALLVTTSYFQPDALETANEATGGGLLNRGKRKSFVKLSRKRGFHLCLLETRDGNFHVNVPEL